MSAQIIPLKGRTDLRGSSRILAAETIRVWAAPLGNWEWRIQNPAISPELFNAHSEKTATFDRQPRQWVSLAFRI